MAVSYGRLISSFAVAGALVASASAAKADTVASFCKFNDQGQVANIQLSAPAQTVADVINLTPDAPANQTGAAYFKTPVELTASTSFRIHFRFRVYPNPTNPVTGGNEGGEGITFTFQNKGLANALGGGGAGLGINGVQPSASVFFDMKQSGGDPSGNYVGITTDGKVGQPIATANAPVNMKAGFNTITDVWVAYDPPGADPNFKNMRVFMAQNQPRPANPFLTARIDLYSATHALQNANKVFVGFTGSTSNSDTNDQDIVYWTMTDTTEFATACIPCTVDNDCVSVPLTPACFNGNCSECSATNNSRCAGSNKPVCDLSQGRCVECNTNAECGGNQPICVNKVCTACASNFNQAPPDPACPSATFPACQKGGGLQGACTECSSEVSTRCNTTQKPVCITSIGTCGCNADSDCALNFICETGACIQGCRSTGPQRCDTGNGFQCALPDGGTIGNCTKGCTSNADCQPPVGICDLNPPNQCVQCLLDAHCPNGQVCDANKKICGECKLGDTTNCDPTGSGGACRSNNTCGCNTDADCSGGRVCNPETKVCQAGCRVTQDCQGGEVCLVGDAGIGQCITSDAGVDAGPLDAGDGGRTDSGTGLDSGTGTTDSGTGTGDSGADSGLVDAFSIEGGGCACSVLGAQSGALSAGGAAFAGLAALAFARRRRRK